MSFNGFKNFCFVIRFTTGKPAKKQVLFICTWNICRSPMAHAFAEKEIHQRSLNMAVKSASTLGFSGQPPHPYGILVMGEVGIDIGHMASTPLTKELIDWADWVYVMSAGHKKHVNNLCPKKSVGFLGNFVHLEEIKDPMGGSILEFRHCRDLIKECIQNLFLAGF